MPGAGIRLGAMRRWFFAHIPTFEGTAMFASKVAKPQTKAAASSKNSLALMRSGPVAHRTGYTAVELQFLQRAIGNQATLRLLAQRAAGLTAKDPDGDHKQGATPESITDRDAPRGVSW